MGRRFYKKSKYENEAVLLHSIVIEVLEKNVEYPNDRIKNRLIEEYILDIISKAKEQEC